LLGPFTKILPILPIVFFLHKRSLPTGLKILVAPLLTSYNTIHIVLLLVSWLNCIYSRRWMLRKQTNFYNLITLRAGMGKETIRISLKLIEMLQSDYIYYKFIQNFPIKKNSFRKIKLIILMSFFSRGVKCPSALPTR
jgi:hypothetical protein